MAVQFILGRAGSGKTHSCLEAVRAELRASQRGPALVFLVPEQATYQTERALVTTLGLGGYCRAFVLSFRRLAYQVFMEVGGSALPPLEAVGKQMILRSILRRRAGDLRLFEKSARQRGFVERLATTLGEMRSYGHGADRLRAESALLKERGEGDSLLAAKLHDLALVVEEYERFLAERYVDPDSCLDSLAEQLAKKNRFHGARVWMDGFASFTGQEERALGALMRVAAETRIALCLDPQRGGERQEARGEREEEANLSMFGLLRETYERLSDLARANGLLVLPPRLLPEPDQPTRFSKAPALAQLERNIFGSGSTSFLSVSARIVKDEHQGDAETTIRNPQSEIPNPKSVALTVAADQRCEVRDVACEILRLCREEGYRFRDIAVIVRDLTPYRALIETIFNDYEIPHFLDVRRDVAHHPLVELVRSALAVARGWRSPDVIRYAKTDLVSVNHGQDARATIDELENYVLEHGIEGDAWYRPEPWRFLRRYSLGEESENRKPDSRAEPLDRINAWRTSLVAPLRWFEQEASRDGATVLDMSRALYGLFDEIGVADRLEQWAAEAERDGRLSEADEHRQVWEAVVVLLDQAVATLGEEPVALDEYREIIEAGLEGIRLRLVPPALDQVLVGTIERSRHPEIRAGFVLGLNERVFPQPHMPDVVFGDRERERLASEGMSLGPVSEKRLVHEQFLAYIAFTRASERLYVSYAEADPMGKKLHPSPYVDELLRVLNPQSEIRNPQLKMRRVERDEPLDRIVHWRAALSGLAAGLRLGSSFSLQPSTFGLRATWVALYGAMRREGRLCRALARRIGGLAYENRARLSLPVTRRFYGGCMAAGAQHAAPEKESSVSRLECFAACPFQHFARYGLALEERLRFRLEYMDLGLLYHAVLKDVFEQLSAGKPLDWAKVEPQRAIEAVENAIARLAPQLRNEILLSSGHNRYLLDSARAALVTFIQVLIAASQRDGFCQAAAEVAFGAAVSRGQDLHTTSKYGALEILLAEDEWMLLRGRIDRIDVAEEDRQVIRIIDYKSRSRRFYMDEFVHGLALQLPTYMLAVERGAAKSGKKPTVAGGLYVPILRGVHSRSPGEAAKGGAAIPPVRDFPPRPNIGNHGQDAHAAMLDLKQWQARGMFEFRWARFFDRDVATAGGRSQVVALAITEKGQPYKSDNYDTLPDGALGDLLRWTERKLADLGREIVSGNIGVSPYRLGNDTPCRWCEFRAICRFDGQHEPYRVLPARGRTETLDWIREQLGG